MTQPSFRRRNSFRTRLQSSRFLGQCAILVFLALFANQVRYIVLFHGDNDGVGVMDHFLKHQWGIHRQKDLDDRNARNETEPSALVVNEIIHRAFFGLGHRLHRSAVSYHLAWMLSLPEKPVNGSNSEDHQNLKPLYQPPITHLRFHWESCLSEDAEGNKTVTTSGKNETKDYNVFRYLFGDDVWKLHHPTVNSMLNHNADTNADTSIRAPTFHDSHIPLKRNMIPFRNDILGYISGQVYKNLKFPVRWDPQLMSSSLEPPPPETMVSNRNGFGSYTDILEKIMRTDVEFYTRLTNNYRFHSELRDFQTKHQWKDRPLVIGVHLRAGNGEKGHFIDSGRAARYDLVDEATMVTRLVQLIRMLASRKFPTTFTDERHPETILNPLLFVATDTAHLIPLIQEAVAARRENQNAATNRSSGVISEGTTQDYRPFDVVTWPQYRLPKNAGVTFDSLDGKGDRCLEGWKASVSDALMLSKVDILVAAKRSTFTQSLPLTLGFARHRHPRRDTAIGNSNSLLDGVRNRTFSFCEVEEMDVDRITCFENIRAWFFRGQDDPSNSTASPVFRRSDSGHPDIWTLSLPLSHPTKPSDLHQENKLQNHVEHDLTILVPDIKTPFNFWDSRKFIRENSVIDSSPPRVEDRTEEHVYQWYGKIKFNKAHRYVDKKAMEAKVKPAWNLVTETKESR